MSEGGMLPKIPSMMVEQGLVDSLWKCTATFCFLYQWGNFWPLKNYAVVPIHSLPPWIRPCWLLAFENTSIASGKWPGCPYNSGTFYIWFQKVNSTALPAVAAMSDTCINLEGAHSEGDNNDLKQIKKSDDDCPHWVWCMQLNAVFPGP